MLFVDLRAGGVGGICAEEASFYEDGSVPLLASDFASRVNGRDLVLATHGFNVSRAAGIAALSRWSQRCRVSPSSVFVGVLWAGDSRFIPVLDYPFEGDEAIKSGRLLASALNQWATGAQSVSLVSHSLGARAILEAASHLDCKVRRLILMAGAIEDDCLTNEYRDAADNAGEIYVLSSREDWVLEFAFPIGNPIGEVVMHGHPYFKTALGRSGPDQPIAQDKRGGAWQIPDSWDYGHGNYLPKNSIGDPFDLPVPMPKESDDAPSDASDEAWKPAWSAGAVATQLL